ncbi:MAG: alpha/beta fold hydrolase [Kouleothrix sp.]|nr:alpha/beta fold hydrolase [Kouleothrix sp.]
MLLLLLRALLFWLSLFEWLAGRRGWWGLTWLGRRAPRAPLGLIALAALLSLPAGRARRALGLALAAPLALGLQVGAGSLRNRALNPLLRLHPGRHADRTVDSVRIAMPEGYLPAIHVTPHTGAAMAVAVLHGSGDHKLAYTWWIVDALLAQGIAALLIDLDGHGENPRPQRFPQIGEDVAAAVDWLRARHPRVGVLGISLGGCIAARAVADGVAVDALAVLEAPPALRFTQADMRREALALAQPRLLDLFGDCTAYQLASTWSTAPIRAEISTWNLIDALDLLGSLPKISAPLLLVYGARDAIVKPAQATQVRAAMPPHAAFRLEPGASHLTLILSGQTLRMVAEWLRDRLRAEGS